MPVPKRKTSKSRRDMRRATHKLTPPAFHVCKHCKAMKRPHHVCMECGYYDGRQVLVFKNKKEVSSHV